MKKFFAMLVMGALFLGVPFCAWTQERWFDKTLIPVGRMIKEAVGEAMKGLSDEIERRIMEALIPETGIGAGLVLGIYYPQLTAVNMHLQDMGAFQALAGGVLPVATIRYTIIPGFQGGYSCGFMSYSTTGTRKGDTYVMSISLDNQFHAFTFVYKSRLKSKFRFYAGADIGWIWATYSEDSGYRPTVYREVKTWSGNGFMACPFAGFQYRFNRIFALGVDCGYAFATIPPEAMKPQAGTSTSDLCPQMDLSGLILKLGPQIHF